MKKDYHIEKFSDIFGEEQVGILRDVVRFSNIDPHLRPVSFAELVGRKAFVARNDAGLIGYVSLQAVEFSQNVAYQQVSTLFVLKSHAGNGLARELIRLCRDESEVSTFAFVKGDDVSKAKAFLDNDYQIGEMPYVDSFRPSLIFRKTPSL